VEGVQRVRTATALMVMLRSTVTPPEYSVPTFSAGVVPSVVYQMADPAEGVVLIVTVLVFAYVPGVVPAKTTVVGFRV